VIRPPTQQEHEYRTHARIVENKRLIGHPGASGARMPAITAANIDIGNIVAALGNRVGINQEFALPSKEINEVNVVLPEPFGPAITERVGTLTGRRRHFADNLKV
jgi:hypothetical protein